MNCDLPSSAVRHPARPGGGTRAVRLPRSKGVIGKRPGVRLALLLLYLLFPAIVPAIADSTAIEEYKIKAALIYKLARFVEWPAGRLRDGLRVCVLGRDPFGPALDVLETRRLNDVRIEVRRVAAGDQGLGECGILFITKHEAADMHALRPRLKDRSILTIGDAEDFARLGGMVQMSLERRKIRFIINLQSAEQAGLKFAAPLLELSTVIRSTATGRLH